MKRIISNKLPYFDHIGIDFAQRRLSRAGCIAFAPALNLKNHKENRLLPHAPTYQDYETRNRSHTTARQ